jgi:predicted DNA-binding transcriptional regulator AlpA
MAHQPPVQTAPVTYLRTADLCARYSVSRVTIHRMKKRPGFPAPVMLSSRTPAWRASEVDAWDASRIASSASTSKKTDEVQA